MQSASIAERSGAIRAASPFRSVDSVAAVASARRGSASSSLLDFGDGVLRLHPVAAVHLNIVLVIIGSLEFGALTRPLMLKGGADEVSHLLQGALCMFDIGEHVTNFALSWKSFRKGVLPVLFLGNSSVAFRKVENGSRCRSNSAEQFLVTPTLEVAVDSCVVSSAGRVVHFFDVANGAVVVDTGIRGVGRMSRRDGILWQRQLARRQWRRLISQLWLLRRCLGVGVHPVHVRGLGNLWLLRHEVLRLQIRLG